MGNQNTQWWEWRQFGSVENRTLRWHPFNVRNDNDIDFEAELVERTEIHEINIRQIAIDFQVPTLNVEFVTNGFNYYNIAWSNTDPPRTIDLSIVASNTIVPPGGDPPLIMEAGETVGFRIDDGNRLNNTDRLAFQASIWGIRFPT